MEQRKMLQPIVLIVLSSFLTYIMVETGSRYQVIATGCPVVHSDLQFKLI